MGDVGRSGGRVCREAEREYTDPAVTEVDQVAHRGLGARYVIDRQEIERRTASAVRERGDVGRRGRVDDDGGQVAVQDRGDDRVVTGHGEDDEPVGRGIAYRGALRDVAVRHLGYEHESELLRVRRVRHAGEELDGRRIAQGVRDQPAEDHRDRAGAPAAQDPGGRVRAPVTEIGRDAQHALAQRGRQALGPVERVGHRARRHAGGARDGHDSRLSSGSGHERILASRGVVLRQREKRCKMPDGTSGGERSEP